MTDREKLIELLKKADENASKKLIMDYDDAIADNADYLLANGVIVPSFKVGDKVYRIANDSKTIVEERVGGMHLEFTIEDGTGWHNTWWLKDYNIGVTTFLTKEEAEETLKELGK